MDNSSLAVRRAAFREQCNKRIAESKERSRTVCKLADGYSIWSVQGRQRKEECRKALKAQLRIVENCLRLSK